MIFTASLTSSSGWQVTGSVVITLSTRVLYGSRPSATTFTAISRSVTIPSRWLSVWSEITSTGPTSCCFIIRAAVETESPAIQQEGLRVITLPQVIWESPRLSDAQECRDVTCDLVTGYLYGGLRRRNGKAFSH